MEAANHTRLWAGSIIITGPEVRPVEDAAADFLCSHARRVRMGKGVGLFRLRSCGPDLQAALPPTTVRMDYPMEVTLASFRLRPLSQIVAESVKNSANRIPGTNAGTMRQQFRRLATRRQQHQFNTAFFENDPRAHKGCTPDRIVKRGLR